MCKSILKAVHNSIEIKKSEFLTVLQPVAFDKDVEHALVMIRKKYPQATHYCYAYILGDHQEVQRYDDNGEPSQTAGIPILEVLKKQNLTNILCVVVRYYGGIKLGAGGLIRAYTKSASEALLKAEFIERTRMIRIVLEMDYALANSLESVIRESGVVENVVYKENVVFYVDFRVESWDFMKDKIIDMSRNTVNIQECEEYITYQKK